MGRKPAAADWELIVGRDLIPQLLPAAEQRVAYRPHDMAWLPDGAFDGLVDSVGRIGTEDLLLVPAVAQPVGWWRRRCLYSPRCVAAVGERGVALWVQTLPVPGVRVQMPFAEISAVVSRRRGRRHALIVTGRRDRLLIRYDAEGQQAVDTWTQRLRQRQTESDGPGRLRP